MGREVNAELTAMLCLQAVALWGLPCWAETLVTIDERFDTTEETVAEWRLVRLSLLRLVVSTFAYHFDSPFV
jgi:hypothetical protein